jgi:crossover junction endodeoxyribonuclease RuvC
MVILGVDPGYAIVGYGILCYEKNRFQILDFGAVTTPAGMEFPTRLKTIYDDLTFLFQRYQPEVMSIEKLFFNTNKKTAVDVAQARGVILLAARNNGADIMEYTPLQVKQSVVGYGRAEKKQVQEMTRQILGLSAVPKPDDTADALALALCHAHSSGSAMLRMHR